LKPEEIVHKDWISLASNLKHVKLLAYCSSQIINILNKICEASNRLESIELNGGNILDEYEGNLESFLRKNVNTLRTFRLPGVNFINILRPAFLYESFAQFFSSYSLAKEYQRKSCS